MRTSSTPSRILGFILVATLVLFVLLSVEASADVFIPPHEYIGYFDSNGVYTVVGNVKNELDYAIIPIISVSVEDAGVIHSKTIQHVPLAAGEEIPFKIKFHGMQDSPVLLPAKLAFEPTQKNPSHIEVLYDKTLVKYDDGHLTGRIHNAGDHTVYNPKIFAVVHGHDKVLDITQNIRHIERIEPGEIVEFSMYPDPAITDDVFYYSCFAISDTSVIPVTAKKDDGNFDFRYDSGAWYYGAEFDESGTSMTINGYNSYPLETYANFEFPQISGDEKFTVTINGKPVEFVQSMDERGFWHVIYTVKPISQDIVEISGFGEGLPSELTWIPPRIKQDARQWSEGRISDSEFISKLEFIARANMSEDTSGKKDVIPDWFRNNAKWWSEDRLSDTEFLDGVIWMIKNDIIKMAGSSLD